MLCFTETEMIQAFGNKNVTSVTAATRTKKSVVAATASRKSSFHLGGRQKY